MLAYLFIYLFIALVFGEIHENEIGAHGPLFFVVTGNGPYEVTYTTTKAKATWIISDRELEIY